jgi:NTP pyrophosphatase (non-canonical NTP hydrolase)
MERRQQAGTLAGLQREADGWIHSHGGYWSPLSQFVRLVEEVGELGRELNHRFGDKPRRAKDRAGSLPDELGDILFIVALLANSLEIDLDAAWRTTLEKYDRRMGTRPPGATEPAS